MGKVYALRPRPVLRDAPHVERFHLRQEVGHEDREPDHIRHLALGLRVVLHKDKQLPLVEDPVLVVALDRVRACHPEERPRRRLERRVLLAGLVAVLRDGVVDDGEDDILNVSEWSSKHMNGSSA